MRDLSFFQEHLYQTHSDRDLARLAKLGGWSKYRIIHPDTFVTGDFDAERINFHMDETNILRSVSTG